MMHELSSAGVTSVFSSNSGQRRSVSNCNNPLSRETQHNSCNYSYVGANPCPCSPSPDETLVIDVIRSTSRVGYSPQCCLHQNGRLVRTKFPSSFTARMIFDLSPPGRFLIFHHSDDLGTWKPPSEVVPQPATTTSESSKESALFLRFPFKMFKIQAI